MIKKVGILILVVCLFVVSNSGLVQARSELRVLDTSVETEFPSELSFSLLAESDVNIIDIRLHYVVDRQSFAQITSEAYIEFLPATTVEASWTWDMRRTGALPPGSIVEYWWVVEDISGSRVETNPVQVQFDDDRYPWRSLTEDEVTIYWYEGEQTFAQELMLSVEQALARLAEDTGAYLKESVRIYIYGNSQDLRGAMVFPQEWTGGVAFTRYGVISIGIAPYNLDWGRGAIAHELTHLVIHQMTRNPYNSLPTWLGEGLAMYSEGTLGSPFTTYLNRAITGNDLISVRSLSSPFSAYAEQSYLAYAQSYSLIEFLINNYGNDKMLELLDTFREGSNYDEALYKVYGFDMDGLDALWRDYIAELVRSAGERETSPVIATGFLYS